MISPVSITPQDDQREILMGLRRAKKSIPPKYLYDERGSELFEKICEQNEYYPVHAETEILGSSVREIVGWLGKDVILIEPGCGNCVKVQYLLEALEAPRAYVAMDISEDFLFKTAGTLRELYPEVPTYSMVADYTRGLSIPEPVKKMPGKRVIFFPGSTIGNMHPQEAQNLLRRMAKLVGGGGGLLIGVDLKKDAHTLELAYDDPKGVTAEFNYNLLDRLNREFNASFDRNNFDYVANYNADRGRVEMFLVSQKSQSIQFGDESIHLEENEAIHTEDSYKYAPSEFIALAEASGFISKTRWTDRKSLFCVYYFETP